MDQDTLHTTPWLNTEESKTENMSKIRQKPEIFLEFAAIIIFMKNIGS